MYHVISKVNNRNLCLELLHYKFSGEHCNIQKQFVDEYYFIQTAAGGFQANINGINRYIFQHSISIITPQDLFTYLPHGRPEIFCLMLHPDIIPGILLNNHSFHFPRCIYNKETYNHFSDLVESIQNQKPTLEQNLKQFLRKIQIKDKLKKQPVPFIVKKMCSYIKSHYAEPLSVKHLSQKFYFSESYLFRIFKNFIGITPIQYIDNVRINQAKKLLRQGYNGTQAAILTGFYDQSHFIHVFKRFTGLTPKTNLHLNPMDR